MFRSTYKNTVKSLLRSVTFWLALGILVIWMLDALKGFKSWAPGFEAAALSYETYSAHYLHVIFFNYCWDALPFFIIVLTTLVLNRDYGDQFYEIEKAANAGPGSYFFGRIAAIISVTLVVYYVICEGYTHIYVVRWGGVEGMSLGAYLADSTLRGLYCVLISPLPCMLLYIGLTYMVGNLFRSGLAGALGGFAHLVAWHLLPPEWNVMGTGRDILVFYNAYLSPMPRKLTGFMQFVGLDNQGIYHATLGGSLGKAALCLAFAGGIFAVFAAISFWQIRKRET